MLELRIPKIRVFEPFFWLYYIWYYLPVARVFFRSDNYNTLFFGIFLGACVLCFADALFPYKKLQKGFNVLIPILIYFAVFILLVIFDVETADRHIRISFTFWGTLIVYFLTSSFPQAQKRLTILFLGLFLITTITSLIGVTTNQNAARILTYAANDIQEDIAIRKLNVGGISFFQGLVICVPILVTFLSRKKYFSISLILLLTIFLCLLSASFTISLTMFFVALVLGYLANNEFSKKTVVVVLILAIIAFVVPWDQAMKYLAGAFTNEAFSARFDSIATSLTYGYASGNLGSRIDVYDMSLKTFLHNFFGVGPNYSYVVGHNGIGYHSQFLDDLARYGIFAVLFYVLFFVGYSKMLSEQWRKIGMNQVVIPVVIVYFLFLIFNLGFTSSHEGVLMLYLIPALPTIIKKM